MTTLIPDSWELPAYTAGDLVPMDDWEHLRRDRITDNIGGAPVVRLNDKMRREIQRIKRSRPAPEPERDWGAGLRALEDMPPYDPSEHPDRDFYNQDDLDHLAQHGFSPTGDPGVWSRHVTHPSGQAMAAQHILTYDPEHRRPTTGERAPWVLTTDPDTVGIAFPSLRGNRGAMAAANADQEAVRRMSKVGAFITHLSHLMFRTAADKTPAQIAAEKWLSENQDFEHPPESDEDWMRAREGDPDEGYTHWEPGYEGTQHGEYSNVRDQAGQTFGPEGEGRSFVMPGWHAGDTWEHPGEENPSRPIHQRYWSEQDLEDHEHARSHMPEPRDHQGEDEDSGDLPEHEQHLEELGFNWRNRGDRDTTPVGEYLNGEYVREQHDPEGNHVATHTMYEDPNGRSDMRWHLEHSPADTPGFVESHTTHRFPSDAISYYHHNAEQALLPSRGYEPHRAPSGIVSHWTRVDHDPQSGAEYHHEISNQPPSGDGNHQGWLGQTFGDHMNRSYAPNGARNQSVQPDLADVVREHDRIGRGLHPGGSQDYRTTRDELLSDPSVASLGEPNWVHDSHFGDGKVGSANWQLPHPNPPSRTVFDPTAPGHAREVPSEHPWINAEATYNWDKGGYDFGYTHNGERIYPTSEHFPAGAPVHVPGRQTRLPLEGAS